MPPPRRVLWAAVLALSVRGYTDGQVCGDCHAAIVEVWQRTGMGRSFFHPSASRIVEDFEHGTFYHETSRTWFEMLRRGDRYFQRRYQIGLDGKQTNVEEKSVDFILGSGNHSRTYLHLTSRNLLQQLPLAWYAESGGHWGMNPGYDQAAHPFARRVITYECIGCHNAYPSIPQGHESLGADPQFELPLPEGIDCRRCHGPGQGHVEAARKEHSTRDEVRHTIVNPARLGAERQMEVCLQCHLETDSSLASHSILRYSEGPFSYKPGQPLGSYRLFLDRTGGTREFQIAQGAYRFRESACFIKTGETFQCTACHDPHSHAKNTDYSLTCRRCHDPQSSNATEVRRHFQQDHCVSCHMPKRRTGDAVHIVMTDHRIQRPKAGPDLLAPVPADHEAGSPYRGNLRLYYPMQKSTNADDSLLESVAKVRERSNLLVDLSGLLAAMDRLHPSRAEFYLDAADGLWASGQRAKAIEYYAEADRRQPDSPVLVRALASALLDSGAATRAIAAIERCLRLNPTDTTCWRLMGLAALLTGDSIRARQSLEKAIALDPESAEAHHELALMLVTSGDRGRAESEFREAIQIQPNLAEAHANLANLLSWKSDVPGAIFHYREALRIKPAFGQAHFGYAAALAQAGRWAEARTEAELAVRYEPDSEEARKLLSALQSKPN